MLRGRGLLWWEVTFLGWTCISQLISPVIKVIKSHIWTLASEMQNPPISSTNTLQMLHPHILPLSPRCSHTDLRSGPGLEPNNCSSTVEQKKKMGIHPSVPFAACFVVKGPRHFALQLILANKAVSVGFAGSHWPLSRTEPELLLARVVQHKGAFLAQQQAARALHITPPLRFQIQGDKSSYKPLVLSIPWTYAWNALSGV